MRYKIFFGIPDVKELWENLNKKVDENNANKDERALLKKLNKTLAFLEDNPRHPSLKTHEIEILSRKCGTKVWESYLENKKPVAGRIFLIYYPEGSITIIAIEAHPNNKNHSYEQIVLSNKID